jgi:hypothetical protein
MAQLTVPLKRWVMVPALLVIEAKARSVPTATVGEIAEQEREQRRHQRSAADTCHAYQKPNGETCGDIRH